MLEFSSNASLLAQNAAQAAENIIPFYQTGTFVFLLLIAAVVFGFFAAKYISSGLKVAEYQGRMSIVLIAVLVASLMIWAKWPPKLGVDLRGGINMIGSLNLDAFLDEDGAGKRPEAADIIPALVRRVNPSGTKEIMIRPLGADKIEVTIPTVEATEADGIWKRLVEAGKLEFRILARDTQTFKLQRDAAKAQAAAGNRSRKVQDDVEGTKQTVAVWVALARVVQPDDSTNKIAPFKFVPQRNDLVRDKASGKILDLSTWSASNTSDADSQGAEFAKWCASQGVRTPQILVIQPEDDQNVEGEHLSNVSSAMDERGRGSVAFKTTEIGSSKMGMLTRMNIDKPMGVVLDGQLHSAPNIQSAIYKNGRITGEFTPEEVSELIITLESGKLDVALNKSPISRDFIESNLGKQLLEQGFLAIGCSLVLVLIFMMLYYRFAGIVATAALLLNLVLILALVMAINQPFTLTGLAGLVLTVGMSVDANVLIFERIREELDRGAALRMAIRNGFDKATTTIIDANVTTLITAVVLYVIGTEQIKGFSVTLILGILMSMFTAIYVSRLIFDIFERKRWLTQLKMTRILGRKQFDFLSKVSLTGIMSFALIVGGLSSVFLLGPKILDHDLRGGSTVRMVFNDAQDVEALRKELDDLKETHNGERVEFSVTGFQTSDTNKKDTVFRVDSNLPAYEGAPQEKFEELADILARVFKGRLKLNHVDVVNSSGTAKPNSTPAQPAETDTEKPLKTGMNWEAGGFTPLASAATSFMLTYQEPAKQENETPPVEKVQQENPEPSATADAKPEAPKTEAPKPEAPKPEAPKPEAPKTEAPKAEAEVTSTQEVPTTEDENEFKPTAPTGNQIAKPDQITRTLKITPGISGKSLINMLVEASETAELELEEEQIIVDSKDVEQDESAASTVSENWEVTMEVNRSEEADAIIDAWSQKLNQTPYFPTTSKVGGQIAGKTQVQALVAIFASLLGIIAYVWVRFQNVAFGLAAVIALIHDVLIVLGAIAISHWVAGALGFLGIVEFKISLEIIAALLTVIGYSLNDTIVVFDRIREVRGKRTEITADIVNASISQTLSRTILTSVTTFIVVFILYCFGGEAIHGFAFALVIGVLVGTYSSIFIASPALLWLMNTVGLNPGEVDPETA
ncbi:protein translocase subunit SecD [bacterium]|nr:protein translocase subunit SecD [bacterium]